MRGSLSMRLSTPRLAGIIPAGAGLTPSARFFLGKYWDHPRGCGAHAEACRFRRLFLGSSPRVRGSLFIGIIAIFGIRIIPAGAGLTYLRNSAIVSPRDHPRGCGAHSCHASISLPRPGSSPRVRGSLLGDKSMFDGMGIIPAGAGLTLSCVPPAGPRGDHPRGCGAHDHIQLWRNTSWGSSPRVRGSRTVDGYPYQHAGIIPAGAGLTLHSPSSCPS